MMTREEVYRAYEKNAKDQGCGGFLFLPYNCMCFKCGFDFYEEYGERLTKMFPTGCPKCNKSFCD
jgi:predicted Zn-ribbon and HTH transcriptional regulator